MAKKDAASKQRAEAARFAINLQRFFDANARFAINLQRAFNDLCVKLNHAYGQPADDAAEMRSQHVLALLATAGFLARVGPTGDLAHFADQLAKLAQALNDLDNGIRAPMLDLALAKRSDPTVVWLARAHVALAVETMRRCGHSSRKSAAKWAAKKYPGLKKLITESGAYLERSKSLEKAIISWCEDFSSHKIRNEAAARVYSVGLDKLKAWASNRNSDQMEGEADRLLQEAVALL